MIWKHTRFAIGMLVIAATGCHHNEHKTAEKSGAAPCGGCEKTASSKAGPETIIPRETLFGNPDRASPQISPDGTKLAFLAPVNGVLNVWVGPSDDPSKAKAVTNDTNRGIRRYQWAYTNQHIIYLQDKGGDENWRVFGVDLAKNETKDLTPIEGVAAQLIDVSHKFPDEILVGLNDRDKKNHDVHRINIRTGDKKLVLQNNEGFTGFTTDTDYNIRFVAKQTQNGGMEILKPAEGDKWTNFITIGMEDAMTTAPEDVDKTGKVLYMLDSRNRNTAALAMLDIATGKETIIGEDSKADVGGIMIHPTERNIQAYSVNYLRNEWHVVDPSVKGDFEKLRGVAEGDFSIGSRTLDDKKWIVAYVMDSGPVRYYLYDRGTKNANFLFTNNQRLEKVTLAKMTPTVIKSRDKMDLVSYLTLPATEKATGKTPRPSHPLPMVLFVHGGPWARDAWGLNGSHQWLANRGYAVLSVNYRGSTGFGKNFINAANMEWAAKMHDDLIDAVNWAVKEKIADPTKVAIMGGSYGGYATLVGLTFTPDTFACGVDIVGPSNLVTLLNTIPPYWTPMIETFTKRVGDHRTEEGKSMLTQRSPLTFADRIKKPLLIGQGANDPRVKQAEADQIVNAMKSKSIPVTYVLYPDEGHGFARPENRMSFNAVAEAFLAEHLGGRYQPVGGDFTNSTISVPAGASNVPGLSDAIATKK
ncbi:MAG: S9 family peptidase [Planctomycetes bacterium]|nr:S9 family peptidase [Planctomycetota bacterium]MBI3836239.1 S9 family peptidase [Planctomycetota bacterium]